MKKVPAVKTKDASSVTNKDFVLYALYEMGGAEKAVHTEDVAAQVFKYPLGKQVYRWERYEQYPDKERVARELRRLKNMRGVPFVKGHVNIGAKRDRLDGWILTPAGMDRIIEIKELVIRAIGGKPGTYSKYEVDALWRRIANTACFKAYSQDSTLKDTKDHVFTDMLYCLPDSPSEILQRSYDKLLTSAKAIGAADLISFLEAARRRFVHLLAD